MKILAFFLICFLVFSSSMATDTTPVWPVGDKTEIELQGTTADSHPKSSIFSIEAYQIGHSHIYVASYQNYTSITISIIDIYGRTIGSQISSLTPQQPSMFDISNYDKGIYTLIITTPQGTYLSGVFDVE